MGSIVLTGLGAATIAVSVLAEVALRDGPSLNRPDGAMVENVEAKTFAPAPTVALTEIARVSTNHADRAIMADIIRDAVLRNSGYQIHQLDDQTTYAGPRAVAQALHQHTRQQGDASAPDPPAYRQLAAALTKAPGPSEVRFTVLVSSPSYELQVALTATVLGTIMITLAVGLTVITVFVTTVFENPRRQETV